MKKSLILGMTALLMAGFTSCSNDEPAGGNDVLDKDQSFYANIQICSTGAMSRAHYEDGYKNYEDPEFDKGTTQENKINSIFLIFYDKEGNRVSTTQVVKDNNAGNEGDDYNSGDVIYKGIVQIDVKHGSQKPAYVMCFVNPISSTNFDINPDFATMESLQATTRPRIIDDNGVFAMSKSVYWGKDRVTNKENQKIVATPLTEGEQLFTSYDAASQAMMDNENSIVDIYVERYAAKVGLEIQAVNPKIKLDSEYTIEFEPEYWAVNAYESSTYICKSFLSKNGTEMTYDELVNTLKGDSNKVWFWNSPDKHRCYWAQTPAYYASSYPRVADDIKDNGADQYALGYYSYNDMVKNAGDGITAKAKKIVGTATTFIYARENTVDGKALAFAASDPNASPKAAIASAVIVGHYNLTKKGEPVTTDMFYVMGNATNGYTVFENTNAMRDYFVRTTIAFASDEEGNAFFDYDNGTFIDGNSKYEEMFTVTHPYKASRKDLTIDSRFVTIQLTNAAKNAGLYAYINGNYELVTDDNFDEVNTQMLYAAGTTQGFKEGKAFYNIPIKHLGFYRDGNVNANKMGTESNFNWKECLSGDFGLVRNHSYSIVVENIKGLGNGIPDPNDPIVPPTDPEEYFVAARIIVLNWAVVPTQNVTL